jgi:autotransporter-associated beta strand protein
LHLGANGIIGVGLGNTLHIYSRISGVFGFTKLSPGTLRLGGTNANTYTGATVVDEGTLELDKGVVVPAPATFVAIPGPLIVASNLNSAYVRLLRDSQIGDTATVAVQRKGSLMLNGHDDTIGSLSLISGSVSSGAGALRLNGNVSVHPGAGPVASTISGQLDLGNFGRIFDCADGSELIVSAVIRGGSFGSVGASVTKSGEGSMTLTAANTYPGNTYVTGGELVVDHLQALGTTNGYTSVGTNAALVLFDHDSFTNNPTLAGERLVLHGGGTVRVKRDCAWEGPVELAGGEGSFRTVSDYGPAPVFTLRAAVTGPGGLKKVGDGAMWLAGLEHNAFAGRTYVEGTLALYQGGFGLNRVSVPGPLVIGTGGTVEVWKSETIQGGPIVVNHLASLLFKGGGTAQSVSNLAVNGGVVDTGPTGLLKLTGSIASTNEFPGGEIRGRLDLGNAPRRIHVQDYNLEISATVSGGPAATLELTGVPHATLRLTSSNSYSGLTLVRSGALFAADSHALGSAAAGVTVTNQGRLHLTGQLLPGSEDIAVTKAFLHLASDLNDISYVPFGSTGSNVWTGPIWLGRDTRIRSHGRLVLNSAISGPAGVEVYQGGEVVFAGGTAANTYAGPTRVDGGTLTLAKSPGTLAVPGTNLTVAKHYDEFYGWLSGRLRLAASQQVPQGMLVDLTEEECALECAGGTNRLARFAGKGDVLFSGGVLRAGFDNQHFQFSGRFLGGNPSAPLATCFEKHGSGVLTLYSSANTLTGAVEVISGHLYLPGALPQALVHVRTGGLLQGPGQAGTVRVDGGTFWPGSGQGRMIVRSCSGGIAGLHPAGTLKLHLYGATNQAGCDRLEVENLVDVENLRLDPYPGNLTLPVGQQFLIISNRSANSILGRFNHPLTGQNLDEGATFFVGTQRFGISYLAGDGNDVVITRVADPAPAQIQGISRDPDGMFLNVSGEPDLLYRVEAAFGFGGTNVWTQIGTATMNGSGHANFIDGDAGKYPMRFYRFVAP